MPGDVEKLRKLLHKYQRWIKPKSLLVEADSIFDELLLLRASKPLRLTCPATVGPEHLQLMLAELREDAVLIALSPEVAAGLEAALGIPPYADSQSTFDGVPVVVCAGLSDALILTRTGRVGYLGAGAS